jgi:hypothetical protein
VHLPIARSKTRPFDRGNRKIWCRLRLAISPGLRFRNCSRLYTSKIQTTRCWHATNLQWHLL